MENINKFLIQRGLNIDALEAESLKELRKNVGGLLYTPIKDSINEKISKQTELSEKDIKFLSYNIESVNFGDEAVLVEAVDEYNMDNPEAFIVGSASEEQLQEYYKLRLAISEANIMLSNLCKDVNKQAIDSKYHR